MAIEVDQASRSIGGGGFKSGIRFFWDRTLEVISLRMVATEYYLLRVFDLSCVD